MADSYKYKAFISYSHADEKWASWLHKALESYRPPKGLVGRETPYGPVPERFAPVFRDRDELATATSLGDTLTQALADSACQIVICSPRAAKSKWTNEEILTFKRLGKSDRIFALIVDGEPGASLNPDAADEECFPPALIYEMGEDGELTDDRGEPIAADARPGKDPKQAAKLKLLAGMLGVGYDDLKQREVQRRHRRMMVLTTAAMIGMAITSGLAVTAYLARNEAQAQRAIAEREAETARQTAQFMVGLFQVSDPSEALGNTITAREILDKGAARIEDELANQPEIQATLMDTMGTVYTSLGLYDAGIELVRKSAERRRAMFGMQHLATAESLNHLGEVQALRAEYDEAESNLRQALLVRRKELGDNSPEVADTLTQLAYVLTEKGEYAVAEPLIRESLKIRRGLFGEAHPEVADSLEDLALNMFDQGDYETPIQLLRDAIAMRRATQSELDPALTDAMNNLAFVLAEAGELDEAESLWQEVLSRNREVLGAEHPDTAIAMSNVAYVLHVQADFDTAEPIYRALIDLQRKTLGEQHPSVADSLNNFAYLKHAQGDVEGAIGLASESLAIKRMTLGNVHPDVADSLNTIAMWTMEQGDIVSAEPLLRESLAMNIDLLGSQHPAVASSKTLLANCLVSNDKYDEALLLADEALEIYATAVPEGGWRPAVARSAEGAALAGKGEFESAEAALLASHEVLLSDPNTMELFVTESTRRLASLYSEWGKPEQAAEYLAALAE